MVSLPITSAYSELEKRLSCLASQFEISRMTNTRVREFWGRGEGSLHPSHPQHFKIPAFPHEHIFSNSS